MTVNFVRVFNHKDAINVEKMYGYKKKISKINFNRYYYGHRATALSRK